MRTRVLATALATAIAMPLLATAAQAAVYTYTFKSFEGQPLETMTGTLTVDNAGMITAMTGVLAGSINDIVAAVPPNPNFPVSSFSPDGKFIYDNLFQSGNDPLLTNPGVLFTSRGNVDVLGNPLGYWNLFSNGPGNYALYESVSGAYPFITSGTFSATSAPAPTAGKGLASFALLALLGVAARFRGLIV
jgi:hypothetical protein